MNGIPLEVFIREWGPTGLLSLCIVGIITGVLVPVRFYREMKEQRDTWQKTAAEALRQSTVLLETARTADATFKALKDVATQDTGTHESAD